MLRPASLPVAFAALWAPLRLLPGLVLALVLSAGPASAQYAAGAAPSSMGAAPSNMGAADARHLLARVGFGPTLAEVDDYARLSREQAVARLLQEARTEAATLPPGWINEPILPMHLLRDAPAEQRRAFQQQEFRRGFELRAWWINEMLSTPSPLTERMTLFWHNHFTSSQQKVRFSQLMYRQNLLLRRHALGNFGQLLHAASKDPAMVIYLDNATNRRDRPNENFAREVMELFTLGEGHYTESDIREAARAFTGWSIDPDTGDYRWRPFVHDNGDKTVLGRSGNFDGDAVLDILLEDPRTAQHVVGKLWREFISPGWTHPADRAAMARVARAFHDSRYDIRVALRELFLSPSFWAEDNRGTLVKSPVDFVVGTLRQFDVRVADATPFAMVTAGLGQNLFAPPNVKGWPGGEAWINFGTLLARKQFVERLFRADEMGRPAAMGDMQREALASVDGRREAFAPAQFSGAPAQFSGAPPAQAGAAAAQIRVRLRRMVDDTRFDGTQWFRQFEAQAARGADSRGDLERFVLATAPANVLPESVSGREHLRLLALDPAYQLK